MRVKTFCSDQYIITGPASAGRALRQASNAFYSKRYENRAAPCAWAPSQLRS